MTDQCIKLTSYFGERHRSGDRFTADALIELYGRHEIAASILLRGTEGFGLKHHLRTDRSWSGPSGTRVRSAHTRRPTACPAQPTYPARWSVQPVGTGSLDR